MRTLSSSDDEATMRALLTRCLDACRACELHCTLTMDVARAVDEEAYGNRGSTVLRACAMICADTMEHIARLREPRLDAIAESLLACRVACRAARSECRRRSFDGSARECAEACDLCAAICEELLAATALAAA
ncbi:MAG: hypothetical protein U0234_18025 [Sandaracinus sp.]